ncbi:MAG TPA: DNA polymerase III subunit beta [Symbiobacteriaceae bacterium]|nr:DNA polymerase III subunit beta [Symbiobacteriaceae bacterium]
MRVRIGRDLLARGLDVVQSIVDKKTTSPILSCVLLECLNDRLTLTATDLSLALSYDVPLNTLVEPGAAAVPVEGLVSIIGKISAVEVEICTESGNQISIGTDDSRFVTAGFPAGEYPRLPEWSGEEVVELKQSVLKRMLAQTIFAAPLDEMMYTCCGVQFQISESTITLLASDGKRLAASTQQLPCSTGRELSFFIPSKALRKISRNLTEAGELRLHRGRDRVLLDIDGMRIMSRTFDGEIPEYRMILPPSPGCTAKVNRIELLNALRPVAAVGTPDDHMAKIELARNRIVVSRRSGELREELTAEYCGTGLVISLDPRLFIDVLEVLTDELTEFEVRGDQTPVVVRSQGYLYIMMPPLIKSRAPWIGVDIWKWPEPRTEPDRD